MASHSSNRARLTIAIERSRQSATPRPAPIPPVSREADSCECFNLQDPHEREDLTTSVFDAPDLSPQCMACPAQLSTNRRKMSCTSSRTDVHCSASNSTQGEP